MFGSKKGTVTYSGDQIETIIGRDTFFKGSINAGGTIRIDGKFEGDISSTSDAIIGETGNITAQVKARNATVAGVITGNMDITEKLELLSSAKLYGDIKVGVLIIGEGATFKGACEMRQDSGIKLDKEISKAAAATVK